MINRILIMYFAVFMLVGCSSVSVGPISAGKNSYVISKQLSSFSLNEDNILESVFSQANEYCLNQNRYMQVEHFNEHVGLIGNDSKLTLVFTCLSQKVKNHKAAPRTNPQVIPFQSTFPKQDKLTPYAF